MLTQSEKNKGAAAALKIMKKSLLGIIITGSIILFLIWWAWLRTPAEEPAYSFVGFPTGGTLEGFTRSIEPAQLSFPADLGPHNDFQTEWWYYTGNLETEEGLPFGFQLTFFRRAIFPDDISGDNDASSWRTNQVYMAHFTVSDIEDDIFYYYEKFNRGALGLAGARSEPYRVWLENWFVEESGDGHILLSAAAEDVSLKLTLNETLSPVLHGVDGLSRKGSEEGNASYYYSLVGQQASGEILIGDSNYSVQGKAWKDHEYSTNALGPEAVGWDWYSLQLDGGSALTFFEIRQKDGGIEPFSNGTYIYPDGRTQHLNQSDWHVEVIDEWTSSKSGSVYPSAWRISVPSIGLELAGKPLMADQELNLSTVYWEGAVAFQGFLAGKPLSAVGYIELTGYAEPLNAVSNEER